MKIRLFNLIIILGLLLTACGTSDPQQPGATEPPTAAGGGTVTLIIPEEPTTLNYYMSDAAITRQIADATSMTGLDMVNEKGEFVPVLATELPTEANGGLSADKLTVTWKLRPGLLWSDGVIITSDDIKFTWEALSDPASGALAGTGGIDQIVSIETPDQLTAIVHYSTPYAGYLAQFAYGQDLLLLLSGPQVRAYLWNATRITTWQVSPTWIS
jgi:peptide/nickel transport system substrate-binding protein